MGEGIFEGKSDFLKTGDEYNDATNNLNLVFSMFEKSRLRAMTEALGTKP